MTTQQNRDYFLSTALPHLNVVTPENRCYLGQFYMCAQNCSTYVVTFKFTDKWEIDTCVKWMN
ncbi:hypothetical protein [Dyadobacter sp. CY323]|uniref:hypothetical protein n=1 Tax=Dyadobacter sp. CY323 TaxID=2907302 RepID=UPI001F22378E|nr:hypothetical protein [Dyadobacter sp. CY323]MCE6988144.1 hypothetical protein [Dyadobacter sp. CY323]